MIKLKIIIFLITILSLGFYFQNQPVYAAPSVNVAPNPVQPGQTFTVHVQGCTANTSVVINYTDPSNNQGNIASLRSGSDGSAIAQSRLTTEGGYFINAYCNNLRDTVTLVVKSPPAAAPNKPFPPIVGMVTSSTAQLTWAAVSGATSYQVWFQKTGSSGEQTAGRANGTSFNLDPLDPASHYSVWINACGNSDCSVRSPASDKETFSTLSAPVVGTVPPPRVSNITSTSVRVSFDSVPGANHYAYTLIEPGGRQGSLVSATEFTLNILEPSITYQISISACPNANNCLGASTSASVPFTTLAAGGGPPAAAPPVNNTNSGTGDLLGGLRSIIGNDRQVKEFGTLGGLVSAVLNVVFLIAGVLMFLWAFVGIFQYIIAGGNKEGLAKARARITWAIIGFLFIMISFALSNYVQQILRPDINVTIPKVTPPK